MAEYKLEVTTGDMSLACTSDYIYATLFGTEGESERTNLDSYGRDFRSGTTGTYTVTTSSCLGRLLLVKLEKEQYLLLPEEEWFCSKVVVTTPEDDVILFPCHRWVSRGELVELRGGKATRFFEDEHSMLVEHRIKEVELRKELYKWTEYSEGAPHCIVDKDTSNLPSEVKFSFSKISEFVYTKKVAIAELKLKGLATSTEKWKDLEKLTEVFWFNRTPISEYVSEHWKEDDFFGSQFLNGTNPNVIQRCSKLPHNFPVTEEMVQPFLEGGSSLAMEMQKGNIFLCDYKSLDGLPTNVDNGKPLPLTAALCLLYKNPDDKLLPIAIQLGQKPSEQNPIFLPSDSEHDWLLAKIFLRNADFNEYQINYHLLATHFLGEAFAIATFRNFPAVHPLYKLLKPHLRYTLHINIIGREKLIGPDGILTNGTLTPEAFKKLIKTSHSDRTYSSLCLSENIAARGLESIPNFYYRDDGLKLWNIINSFVQGMLEHYYPSDNDVSMDSELQEWIGEIFTHGFLGNSSTGFPQSFCTVEEVVRFVTVVIFTVSAQHNAVNMGQFDYGSWIPNNPLSLYKAPPTTKGSTSMETILETLPNIGVSTNLIASGWLLSKQFSDFIPLGTYPDEYFDEPAPKLMIKTFQAELSLLSKFIIERNTKLALPYTYLNPATMENSVAIELGRMVGNVSVCPSQSQIFEFLLSTLLC